MKYNNMTEGRFIERPNRFIAYAEIPGVSPREKVHVKNTGRCRELLVPGAVVYLEKSGNPGRSTAYDLIGVKKGACLVNMDSQAPNKVVQEWLSKGGLLSDIVTLRPETTWGNSRFDFYVETKSEKCFLEVKGVTLEEDGVARFPDAPSERAVKHVEELIAAKKAGFRVFVIFVIQMKPVRFFVPNWKTHPEFCEALVRAEKEGVELLALDCIVERDSLQIDRPVEIYLTDREAAAAGMSEPLLAYYDANRRVLPWREEPSAYRVWVSEIMLQQTRVEAVKPYFARFMETLPDIPSLAEAEEETLLKLWEGLGYYSRVRNLGKAAKLIMERFGGKMPADFDALCSLPGIGSYTAGAIASIAYGKRVPAVDGNVLRVMSRIFADGRDILQASVKKDWETLLRNTMSAQRPGDFNQAMMDVGATVCVPNGVPKCEICPFVHICEAHRKQEEQAYPFKAPKKARTIEERTVLILRKENKTVLTKRPEKGLLAGMYEFPVLTGHVSEQEAVTYLKGLGIDTLWITPLEEATHIFTHKEWHMTGYMIRLDEWNTGRLPEKWILVEPEETKERYPIPSAYAKYMKYLRITVGYEVFKGST